MSPLKSIMNKDFNFFPVCFLELYPEEGWSLVLTHK